jgi:hypothetical protein
MLSKEKHSSLFRRYDKGKKSLITLAPVLVRAVVLQLSVRKGYPVY